MNNLTIKMAELGNKIQTGAAEFAEKHELEQKIQPLKQKAGELTAKAGDAIKEATKSKESEPLGEGALVIDGEGGSEEKPKRASVLGGLAEKLKPAVAKVEESSIGDILLKAKAKVFGGDGKDETTGSTDVVVKEGDDADLEDMKSDVDSIADELSATAEKTSNKAEVQKLLVPLLSKLKVAQDKFAAMIEARKKKMAEAAEAEPKEGEENSAKVKVVTAVKKAFENAEKVARAVAKKAGIFEDKEAEAEAEAPKSEEATAAATPAMEEPTTEAEEPAAAVENTP
jgi:hypothetical protein